MPGPPPEHPHLRLVKGNPGKRRARVPPEPARADECPPPPNHLNGYAREAWLELTPELHRLNLLTVLDVGPFSAYCSAYAHLRQAEEEQIAASAKQETGISARLFSHVRCHARRIANLRTNSLQQITELARRRRRLDAAAEP